MIVVLLVVEKRLALQGGYGAYCLLAIFVVPEHLRMNSAKPLSRTPVILLLEFFWSNAVRLNRSLESRTTDFLLDMAVDGDVAGYAV
jgi:hypothetical protein